MTPPSCRGPTLAEPLLGGNGGAAHAALPPRAVLACLIAYIASGISQPLLMSAIKLAGLGDTSCQVFIVPYYLGMASIAVLVMCKPPGPKWHTWPLHRCAGIALVGMMGQSLNWSGNMLAGSSIFSVVYASVTIWSAVLSRFILRRVLSGGQWCAVFVVFIGLAMTGVGAKEYGLRVLLGACMVCTGAFLHASSHVLSEFVSVQGAQIPPHVNAAVQGATACAIICTWQMTYTVSHWEKIDEPMQEAGTSWAHGLTLLLGIAVGNFVHAASFFYLLTHIGAVATGVLKALQAVLVFLLSHVLYCSQDSSQCISPTKGAALVVVLCGVLGYVMSTAAKAKAREAALPK